MEVRVPGAIPGTEREDADQPIVPNPPAAPRLTNQKADANRVPNPWREAMGMNRLIGLTLGAAALSLSVLVAGTTADKQMRKFDKVDLSDLRDGETRTLGKGEHAITATRQGDEIAITYGGKGGEKQTIQCTVGKDSCYAMTLDETGKSQVVVVDGSGKNGKELDRIFVSTGDGDARHVMVVSGEGDEGGKFVMSGHPGMEWTAEDGCCGDGDAGCCAKGEDGTCAMSAVKVVKLSHDGGVTLECPEGDATLTLKKGEENSGPYFCPKHNVKMEKAKAPTFMKRIVVDTNSKDDKSDEE